MAGCEFRKEFVEHFGARIASELVEAKSPDGGVWSDIWCVASSIAICQSCGQIAPEDASQLFQRIVSLYPQFEEKLQRELEQKFGPREAAVTP